MALANVLTARAEKFVVTGTFHELEPLLIECMSQGGIDGLNAVKILFADMYGGETYNMEFKTPAAFALIRWGVQGLEVLAEVARPDARIKTQLLALDIWVTLASGVKPTMLGSRMVSDAISNYVMQAITDWQPLFSKAKQLLREFFLSFDDEMDLSYLVGSVFQRTAISGFSSENPPLSNPKQIFIALSGRWLAIDSQVLNQFQKLIEEKPHDEPVFQQFLEKHPQLLDPLAFEVWPRPNLHGAKIPDFLIRRTDGTYLVIEIETPAKQIITSTNQLSSEATHAVTQAVDYADFFNSRQESIRDALPDFRPPDALIVVGLERSLNAEQARALQRENRSRNFTKIVGFDYLFNRAQTTISNFTEHSTQVIHNLRIT